MENDETETTHAYIQSIYTEDTGGGFICDVLILDDGHVLVISEEAIVLYEDVATWEENSGKQVGVIYRPTAS